MKLRRVVIGTIVLAGLIVVAGIVMSFLPTKAGDSVARADLATPHSIPATNSPGRSFNTHFGTAVPTPQPSAGVVKQDNSLLGGSHRSSETIPTATPTPYRLHPTAAPTTLTSDDVAATAPQSNGVLKKVASAAGTTQVFLTGTTTTKPAATIAYYQSLYTALGMRGKQIPAVGGSTAIAFSRGESSVTVTVSAHDKGSRYLIHGVLRSGS